MISLAFAYFLRQDLGGNTVHKFFPNLDGNTTVHKIVPNLGGQPLGEFGKVHLDQPQVGQAAEVPPEEAVLGEAPVGHHEDGPVGVVEGGALEGALGHRVGPKVLRRVGQQEEDGVAAGGQGGEE